VVKNQERQSALLECADDKMRHQVMQILDEFKQELDDHREAINDNTNETQSISQYVNLLNAKIDRIAERLDELTLLVKGKPAEREFKLTPLNNREKEVFMVLYTLTQTRPYTTYREIARKIALSEALVGSYITNLIEKGIPVLKKYADGTVYLRLEEDFRKAQATKNIVGVNSTLASWTN